MALALVLGVTTPASMGPIYGKRFVASVPPLLLLLPGIVLFTVTIVLSGQLAGVGRQMVTSIVSAAAFVCTLVLDVLLIPGMGASGAAIASTCSYMLSTWFTWRYFKVAVPAGAAGSGVWVTEGRLAVPLGADVAHMAAPRVGGSSLRGGMKWIDREDSQP